MSEQRFPLNATVYEAMRARPGASARLSAVGLTREFYDYRISDAARAVGLPVERLAAILAPETGDVSRPNRDLIGV